MGTAQVFSFARRRAPPDWTAQDIAEFYRVEAILIQSGLQVTSTRGLTDEGDPWFVFCRAEDDEVIIHFARIDGRYVISSPAYCGNAAGYDFRALIRGMIDRHPVLRPKPTGDNLFLHPASLLVMLVATAFLKSGHAADAAAVHNAGTGAASDAAADPKSRAAATPGVSNAEVSVALDPTQETLLLSAINAAIVASAPQHTITEAPTPVSTPGPDPVDQPLAPAANSIAMDRPHDAFTVGSSGIVPTSSPSSAALAPVDPTINVTAHSGSPNDAVALKFNVPEPLHYQPSPDGLTVQAAVASVSATPDQAPGVQHVSLSGASDIPQADKVLLQALGVPDTIAYAPTPPAAISTAIHHGVHTTAVATPVAGPAATAAVPAPSSVPELVNVPAAGPAETQGVATPAAVPDIASVMHIVLAFEAVEAQPSVLLSDHGIIFYDAATINGQYGAVKSVTYDFGDGFSISLVGLPVELTHAGVHV